MSQAVCLIFFLVTLLAVISTPTNATPLEKKWKKECCPISVCEFKKKENPLNFSGFGYAGNTFDGFLSFTEEKAINNVFITGFIDIHGTIIGPVEPIYDIHVASCKVSNNDPGDPAAIDLDTFTFNDPILAFTSPFPTVFPGVPHTPNPMTIEVINQMCCWVVEEFSFNFAPPGQTPPAVQRVLGVAPVVPIIDRDCNPPKKPPTPPPVIPYSSSSTYYSEPTPTPSGNSTA
jgi:hypothetical protein